MDKSKISLIIGMACTMVGAFVINQGFGFIVTGIWAFIASFVESIKEEEQAEQEAPSQKKEIWHDVKLNTPGTDGWILLCFKGDEPGYYVGIWYAQEEKFYDPSEDIDYAWEELQSKGFSFWCNLSNVFYDDMF